MPAKIHTRDSDLWALDTSDCSDIKFHGYEIVLKEKWVCPHESEDGTPSSHRLDGSVEIISIARTLVPAYAIDVIKSRLNTILLQFPASTNRYDIVAYHVGYGRSLHRGKYENKRKRKIIYKKIDRVGGRAYDSGIIGWDDKNRRIITNG